MFLLVGFWDWIPVSVSGTVTTIGVGCGNYGCDALIGLESFPAGQNVSVQWVDESGGAVDLRIYQPESVYPTLLPCGGAGSSGTCWFISVVGNYTFQASNAVTEGRQVVNFTATYLGPIL